LIRFGGVDVDYDLLSINFVSALLFVCVIFFPDSPLRIVLGVPFVLFFPGYTFTCALYPGRDVLDWVDRAALSVGLSLSAVPLIALGLNYTPWGIRLHPVLVSLLLFTLGMSVATMYRRRSLPEEARFVPTLSVKVPRWGELGRSDRLMLTGLIGFTMISSGFTAYLISTTSPPYSFTEFFVLGPEGKFGGYSKNMTLGESGTLVLGIVNREHADVAYTVVVELENDTIGGFEDIRLVHDGRWEGNFTFTPERIGDNMRLKFILYRDGGAEPYRSLQLFVTVKPRE